MINKDPNLNKWNESGTNIAQSKREQHPCNEFLFFFTTLTALLRSELSSSECLPRELGGLPREFWRRSIGGVPGPRCSPSCWTSALIGDVRKIRVSETGQKKKQGSENSAFDEDDEGNVMEGPWGRQRGPPPLTRRSRSAFASLPRGGGAPCACCRGSPARSP